MLTRGELVRRMIAAVGGLVILAILAGATALLRSGGYVRPETKAGADGDAKATLPAPAYSPVSPVPPLAPSLESVKAAADRPPAEPMPPMTSYVEKQADLPLELMPLHTPAAPPAPAPEEAATPPPPPDRKNLPVE